MNSESVMITSKNTALYVDHDNIFSVRTTFDYPTAERTEIIVRVMYSGVNPADIKHSEQLGITDTVIGYDFCGEVVDPGSTPYSKGDIVAGMTPTGIGRPDRYGAHADFLACPENMLWGVPSNLPQHHAAAFGVVAGTAADVIFSIFGAPLPGETHPIEMKGPILIWGGSTGVGMSAIQFARAAGYSDIFTTASPERHDLLESIGATACFDYNHEHVVSQIKDAVRALGSGNLKCALDSVGTPSTAQQVEACAGVATVLASTTQTFGRFRMPFATHDHDAKIRIPGTSLIVEIPADVLVARIVRTATEWASEHYGSDFILPDVEVFTGTAEGSLEKIKTRVESGSYGKLVIQHPFSARASRKGFPRSGVPRNNLN